MRLALLAVCVLSACASARAPVSDPGVAPVAAARPHGRRARAAGATAHHEIRGDALPPPEFAAMSPREREQWHACRMFLFHRVGARFDRNGQPLPATTLEFSITVHDYLAQPDAHERRKLLIEHGCPDAIVDLADGTHLDIVEGP